VALTPGVVWLCNETHSKIDRFDWRSGDFKPIDSPGVPRRIRAGRGRVWATVDDGWILRVNVRTGEVHRWPVRRDPDAFAIGFGYLWVSHPDLRLVTKVDLHTGREVGRPIHVTGDVRAVEATARSVWLAGGATNRLQRIDPRTGKVEDTVHVEGTPSDLDTADGRLYVSLLESGTVREVLPVRR
jgi:streptogramin lyase